MEPILIGSKEFTRGESSSKYTADGGFSPDSYNLNLTRKRGVLDFAPSLTDRGGATLTGNIIASAYDKTLSSNDGYFLDASGAFYTLDGANTFTKRQTITADTFTLGTSEILQFTPTVGSPFLFATGTTSIIRMTGPSLVSAAPDTDFWTGLSTGCRHPIERVEDKVYFGDLNLIHAWDGTTTTSAYVTLPPDVNITSLRKHPDGVHLIAFCGLTQNASHTQGSGGRIYVIDTILKRWIREIDTEAQVEGSRLVGGVVYVTYGYNVGYFNGDGIQWLKRLADSSTTYSHNLGNMEDILLVRDGRHVRAFGDLGAGKVWWRCAATNTTTDDNINNILYRGNMVLLIAYRDTGTNPFLKELNYANTGSTGIFFSNRYDFPAETKIRRIEVIHKKAAGALLMTCNDEEDNVITLSEAITTDTVSSKTRREVNYLCDRFQYRQGQGPGEIHLIRIYHEPTN